MDYIVAERIFEQVKQNVEIRSEDEVKVYDMIYDEMDVNEIISVVRSWN